jgi:hypothetical protein
MIIFLVTRGRLLTGYFCINVFPPLCFQVHYILNELVMGGMVLETNMTEILLRIEEQNKIEKEEVQHFIMHFIIP